MQSSSFEFIYFGFHKHVNGWIHLQRPAFSGRSSLKNRPTHCLTVNIIDNEECNQRRFMTICEDAIVVSQKLCTKYIAAF